MYILSLINGQHVYRWLSSETCGKGCPELSQATASMRVQGWRTLWTFNVTDFMLMCLLTRFPSSFLENFTWYAVGWIFLLQNLRL